MKTLAISRNTRLWTLVVLAMCFGCGDTSTTRYVPSSDTALTALQQGLDAWQSGATLTTITVSTPAVNVFDMRWQQGAKLEKYEIVKTIEGREHPTFEVQVTLDKKSPEKNTYIVVGIDPLLVFRDVDYQKATGQ